MANDVDALIPEIWAQEGLLQLENNMVAGSLVHRDFSNDVASVGDTVNTRKPAAFTARRKGVNDDVTDQDATATNVPIVLNQHVHTSFVLRDSQTSMAMGDLFMEFLNPAVVSIAQAIDQTVIAQRYQFLANSVGALGTTPTLGTFTALEAKMNTLMIPNQNRRFVMSPSLKATALGISNFVDADKSASAGALRDASLGRLFGIDTYMDQNCTSIPAGNTAVTGGAINNVAGYPSGTATAMAVDGYTGDAVVAGDWITIAGIPYQVSVATSSGSDTNAITVVGGLRQAVANDAVIIAYTQGAYNGALGTLALGYKDHVVNVFTVAPQKGQLITFGTDATRYSALDAPTTTLLRLDRPLEVAVTNTDAVGVGPAGEYGFAFHRDAISLVTRPLSAPLSGAGAQSFVANHGGLSMRAVIAYDSKAQGHRIVLDILAGVKVLDTSLGVVVLG